MTRPKFIRSAFGKGRWLFLLTIILLLLSMFYEKQTAVSYFTKADVDDFQEVLHAKETRIGQVLDLLESKYKTTGSQEFFTDVPRSIYRLYREEGLAVFVYNKDSLCFWNDNSVPFPELTANIPESSVDQIGNSVFLKKEILFPGTDSLRFVGLILIKTEYPYENRFLHNSFQSAFPFTPAVRIRNSAPRFKNPVMGQGYPVYDKSGHYLFSIDLDSASRPKQVQMILCLIFYLLTFFVFLMFLRRFIRNAPHRLRNLLIVADRAGSVFHLLSDDPLPDPVRRFRP